MPIETDMLIVTAIHCNTNTNINSTSTCTSKCDVPREIGDEAGGIPWRENKNAHLLRRFFPIVLKGKPKVTETSLPPVSSPFSRGTSQI